jgi:hypothetical protein
MPENPSAGFSRETAIALLISCQPLALRLTAEGLNLEITEEEHLVLLGFKKVWLAGYLDGSSHIYREAGLSRTDLAALNRLLARSEGESMRQQHASGNG